MGHTPTQQALLSSTVRFCDQQLSSSSIYRYLYENSGGLFPDEAFADLFQPLGRESIPPRIVAVVMVLQRLEGLSDREAVERFAFDARWKYAAGGLDMGFPSFVHTVLVRMRARLRDSDAPNRIFDIVLDVAKSCGLVGRKRVVDSTPIYDAVATQDTVTLIRSAIRGLLKTVDAELEGTLRQVIRRDDDYVKPGKPECDWTDAQAREALVDALCRDAHALLAVLDGRQLSAEVRQAAELLATVVDQDTEETADHQFRIVRKVAKGRVISTVDPEARHGHKSKARKFDGYKGHISVDPDSEIITATAVTPANAGDASVAPQLVQDVLEDSSEDERDEEQEEDDAQSGPASADGSGAPPAVPSSDGTSAATASAVSAQESRNPDAAEIYGDAAYGTAEFVEHCANGGAHTFIKVQSPAAREGKYSKEAFSVDLERDTVTCPALQVIAIQRLKSGAGRAEFGEHCRACEQRSRCTDSENGRIINVHAKEHVLQRERHKQRQRPEWRAQYTATRPKVERKLGHMTRRLHGGRRARVRGSQRVAQDFSMRAAALNLQRLATLGVERTQSRPH